MKEKNLKQKIEEAVEVGWHTLDSLQSAQIKLDSAKSWIVLEGFGGSLLTSMMKHMKTADTREYVEAAKQDIMRFQVVLKSIVMPEEVRSRTGMYIAFATFFLDGTIDEYMMKSNVDNTQEQIADAIQLVDEVCKDLEKWCAVN